ncbi:hypothetical protein Q8A64_02845 [Oxalobacteraceae bacterium R-40]|uniref:Uncharacterized protein n=1 Tax=Keguizhuia sedimenti TaxID=3064264 RepID=A0ABU1BLY4_9BURK|nr:hypothetical protein [Oxalobacteraceae bacterium R-40]
MHINRIIEETLTDEALDLLNMLAAHAVTADAGIDPQSVFTIPVEENNWNATLESLREIFEAEILISDDDTDWLSFRILQSIGVKNGQLAYQFTPTFSQTLR